MSRCGDVYENKVTGEYAVVLRGTEDRGDGPAIAHLTARPGAAVAPESSFSAYTAASAPATGMARPPSERVPCAVS